MARPNLNQTIERGITNSQAVEQANASDVGVDEPGPKAPAPALSAAEEIAALQARLSELTAAANPTDNFIPGSTVRPMKGPIHPGTGAPIFNSGRPTGRAG